VLAIVWIPVYLILEVLGRTAIVLINAIIKSANNTWKFIVLILVSLFAWIFIGFIFLLYAFIQAPTNIKNYLNNEGSYWDSFVVLVWESENTLQDTLAKFFDNLSIGSDKPAGEEKKDVEYQPVKSQ
jgi:hypothetical protein